VDNICLSPLGPRTRKQAGVHGRRHRTFPPGTSTVAVFCPVTSHPSFANTASVTHTNARIEPGRRGCSCCTSARICISTVPAAVEARGPPPPARRCSKCAGRARVSSLVRIPRDPRAVDVQVEPPRRGACIYLPRPRACGYCLSASFFGSATGRAAVSAAHASGRAATVSAGGHAHARESELGLSFGRGTRR